MSEHDSDHRYTEQEVALLLQRAAELESKRSELVPTRGLSLRELREIAREVGIGADVFDEAVASVQAGVAARRRDGLSAPLSSKAARGVAGQLSDEATNRLLRVLEEHVEAAGTVTVALGTVRWIGAVDPRFDPTMQVSVSARSEETQIQVVRRYPPATRVLLHVLPTVWSGALFAAIAAGFHADPTLLTSGGLGAAVVGFLIGHGIWQRMARRNAQFVQRVAGLLAETAREEIGDAAPSGE